MSYGCLQGPCASMHELPRVGVCGSMKVGEVLELGRVWCKDPWYSSLGRQGPGLSWAGPRPRVPCCSLLPAWHMSRSYYVPGTFDPDYVVHSSCS